jgi:hypothetical protein
MTEFNARSVPQTHLSMTIEAHGPSGASQHSGIRTLLRVSDSELASAIHDRQLSKFVYSFIATYIRRQRDQDIQNRDEHIYSPPPSSPPPPS